MQTICDGCRLPAKKVGRLSKITRRGLSQMLCKVCKKKSKMNLI